MARPKKPQAYTGVVTLGVVLLTVLLSPDWTSLQVIKAVHALFTASFFTFNYLCYRLKSAVVEANDQRVIKVPTDDGKGTQSQSVSAYDTDACNMLMVKGTLVRPSVLPAPHNHLCMCVSHQHHSCAPQYYGLALFSGNYRKAYQLMLIQALSQPLQAYDSELSMIHLRGGDDSVEGLERPWKHSTFLSNLMKLQSDYDARQESAKARAQKKINGLNPKSKKAR